MNDPARSVAALPESTRGLVVAFSGGRDSTALLHALAHAGHAVPLRAVHVCHHLEASADAWALHCARWCAAAGIAFVRCDVTVDARRDGLEAAARRARYAALAGQLDAGDVLACAHHARDQAETFLIQALRGAGAAGLAAMPRLAPFAAGRIWRPWLGVDRAAITAYAEAHGLNWIEDRTNLDQRRARGYLRSRIWPALDARWPAAATTLARSAAWMTDAAAAIDTLAAIDLERARRAERTLALEVLAELTAARAGEVVRRWLAEHDLDSPDHRHVDQIRGLIHAREHAGPRVAFANTEVRRFDGRLFAMPRLAAPPAASTVIAWSAPDDLLLPSGCGRLLNVGHRPPVWPDDLWIGFRRGGERLARDDGSNVALAEWLRAARVPPWIRERLPLVYAGDTLIAIPGYWQHPRYADWFGLVAPVMRWAPCHLLR